MVTIGLSRTVSEINGDVRRKSPIFPPPVYLTPPLKGFPLEFCIGAGVSDSQKTRVMGLSDGRKSFPIGLAVLIQYRSVTASQPATQPPSHVAVAITLNAKASSLKTIVSISSKLSGLFVIFVALCAGVFITRDFCLFNNDGIVSNCLYVLSNVFYHLIW